MIDNGKMEPIVYAFQHCAAQLESRNMWMDGLIGKEDYIVQRDLVNRILGV